MSDLRLTEPSQPDPETRPAASVRTIDVASAATWWAPSSLPTTATKCYQSYGNTIGPTNKKRPLNGAAPSLDRRNLLGDLEARLFDGVGHLGHGHQRTRDLVEQLVGIFLFRQ
jgi:hypothetical protein